MIYKRNNIKILIIFLVIFNIFFTRDYICAKENEKIYVMLDEVYPFDDLNLLVEKIDYLYDKGYPFIMSAMPVFNNTNSNAMRRYAEVLRYAQAKGGAIILHFPYIYQKDSVNAGIDDILGKMTKANKNFLDYLVYPSAIYVPEDLLYYNEAYKYLNTSNTIFLDTKKEIKKIDVDSLRNIDNIIEKIPIEDFYYKNSYFNNKAITLKGDMDIGEFKNNVQMLDNKEVYFDNFKYVNTYIHLGDDILERHNGSISLNNSNVTPQKFISIEEFENMVGNKIENKPIENNRINLFYANKWIILLTILASFIFIIIVIRNRNLDRKKFLK
ncbi:DUF2334 domain-containing protein [Clostridium sp. MB05]|uniref:DUF2334 domain-containing protein n=1 Tax=Clostridium sp. MB05 TaxID=3376682 RepID=UPI0039825B01